jgi:uncharacterized paraquat-inducible protein A
MRASKWALSTLVMAGLVAAWYYALGSPVPPPAEGVNQQTGYLYCPECGFEMHCNSQVQYKGMVCARCGIKATPLLFSEHSQHWASTGTGAPRSARIVPLSILSVTVVLGLTWYLVSSRRQGRSKKDIARRCHCPHCGRKIAYGSAKEKLKAICPACKTVFVLKMDS